MNVVNKVYPAKYIYMIRKPAHIAISWFGNTRSVNSVYEPITAYLICTSS